MGELWIVNDEQQSNFLVRNRIGLTIGKIVFFYLFV